MGTIVHRFRSAKCNAIITLVNWKKIRLQLLFQC